mgnify:CR=1 FL=1
MLLFALACAPKPAPPETSTHASPRGLSELVTGGPLESRLSEEAADVVLLYGGELRGRTGPCGCPTNPRGGLARAASYIDAVRERDLALLVLGGYQFEDERGFEDPAPIRALNADMAEVLDRLAPAAGNVTWKEWPLLDTPDWAVSANIDGVVDSRVIEVDGLRIGVVGITARGPVLRADVSAPGAGLDALRALDVDLHVLLAFEAREEARAIAEAFPELDVVVDTAHHQGFFEPVFVGETIWVRSAWETQRLGELRLAREGDGWRLVRDRMVDLDDALPDAPGYPRTTD